MGGGVGYQEPTVDLKHEHKKFRDIRITAVCKYIYKTSVYRLAVKTG